MNILCTLYAFILFFALSPGILVTAPVNGKFKIALVHAALFALILHFTHKMVYVMSVTMDGFTDSEPKKKT